ncbi:cupin domain-containing protein [Saccharopolyspora taberi]|uniref:JmjC domain-containing protein n=1 Tax=Saccharopolyspora taberi TaxID=60895 RepID=A0ABN3VET5_9PSEU
MTAQPTTGSRNEVTDLEEPSAGTGAPNRGSRVDDPGLAWLVAPKTTEEFFANVYGRDFQVFGEHSASRFTDLFDWDALNRLLTEHRLDGTQLRLLNRGRLVPEYAYTAPEITRFRQTWQRLRPGALTTQLRAGATLRLRDVDQLSAPVRDLAAALERDLRESVGVNLYASCTDIPGSNTHYDPHDVLVVQLAGRKSWKIFGPRHPLPLQDDMEMSVRAPEEPITEFVLEPGQVLYLPRGWWHAVNATSGPSLHLTFGLRRATGADLLEWVAGSLRDEDLVRADLPRFEDSQTQHAYLAELRRLVLDRLQDPTVLDRMAVHRDAARQADPGYALPHTALAEPHLPDDDGMRAQLRARRAVVTEEQAEVLLSAGGLERRYPVAVTPVLKRLAVGREVTLAELVAEAGSTVSSEQVGELLVDLARAGLVALRGPE